MTEDKPIFLSIGYSTCHWCHVMAHESFEDTDVAALFNQHFVCIKVDREERPDIDDVYMTVCQAMTGSGGWPLSLFLTPDKRPFFAATYIPRQARQGRPGLMELLPQIARLWQEERPQLEEAAGQVQDYLVHRATPEAGEGLSLAVLEDAWQQLAGSFDAEYGGFGDRPKFPIPHNLGLLLRWWQREGHPSPLEQVSRTLDAMRAGGLFDQLGGGFHRYSTDRMWLLPHFEKMLYDQALLASAYVEAWQVTGEERFAQTARETLDYVLRDLASPEGAFYSAQDADSEGIEGKYYVWTTSELRRLLTTEDAEFAIATWGLADKGNFQEEATGEFSGANVLHLARAKATDPARLERIRARLLEVRCQRVPPATDDKVLTDWNGLALAAFAFAGRALAEPRYIEAGRNCADFLLEKLLTPEGQLLHRYHAGEAGLPGLLDDYAFLAWGLVELYQATFEPHYLQQALNLARQLGERFADAQGGYFLTPSDGEALLVRRKDAYDGAAPSGNSIAALVLLKLSRLTGDERLADQAEGVFKAFSPQVENVPTAFTQLLQALDFALGPSQEVVIVAQSVGEATDLLQVTREGFLPRTVVHLITPKNREALVAFAPWLGDYPIPDSGAAAYACEDFACQAPVTMPEALEKVLGLSPRIA